ncbi:hypothetical protein BBK82_34565 [Lentzea guizhouensis]|uniref:Uncharacterized protein n=1 Tax=Lentzea guizhouensis TaxID=1586287 RepID=A0A1B2HRP5_9PSEU|nr:hypothetical protein [Lentzea guizhouensis]ANZ40389.1 hypothetical protein BBK82_34565 [Lentzea guizhouensis]
MTTDHADATSAPAPVVLTHANPAPVSATATAAACRPTGNSSASTAGATTRPAKSLSLPVTSPGHACLSTWSLTSRTAVAAIVTGCATQRRKPPARMA